MHTKTYVYLDLDNAPRLVGRLWSRVRRGRESASFQYDDNWLADPERFALKHYSVRSVTLPPIGGGVCSWREPNVRKLAGKSVHLKP